MKLSNVVAEYVSFKQGIGMWYRSEARLLRSFCRTVGDVAIKDVDAPSVEAFLAGVKGNIASVWRLKYTVLNGLFRFAINRKYTGSSPLPRILPKRPEPGLPHIYTIDELQSLLKATDSLQTRMSPLQAATFRMLLILYGTGLRISEALALTIADVDVRNSLIIVPDSKFFKTRIVPTGPRLTDHLRVYLEERRRLARPLGEDSAFLATPTGHALSYYQASKVFRRLRNLAGLHRTDGARYAPRVHDIRHSSKSLIIPSSPPKSAYLWPCSLFYSA
jgi:site-specific recombinase XerD